MSARSWAADEEIVALLARIAENVSFALDNFDRADEKAKADEQKERLTRMFAALSATNEAIMRAKSRTELFELVCEAAAQGRQVQLHQHRACPARQRLSRYGCRRRADGGNARKVRCRPIADHPEGRGLCGTAFRSRQASISNDLVNDPRGAAFLPIIRNEGARSGAAFPLLVDGQSVGVMLFISSEIDTFTPEFAELLQRLADNVSFALGNFDRADEKARTEEQKERLTRMLAALSATNEAIMRARSRSELFELVCEAAANGGKFTATTIALVNPNSEYLDIVATAGPTAASAREVRMSVNEAQPEGRGISGMAFRSGKASIMNDYLADSRSQAFHARARRDEARSGAAFPLFARGQVVGIIALHCHRKDTRSRRNLPNCCNGWRTTSPSRWKVSIVPTKRPGRMNGSNIWRRTTA